MNRVLVTGARGFVGSHCLAPFIAQGFEVHAVSTRPVESDHEKVIWHRADLLDRTQIGPLLDETCPTHLLHLAWIATPGVLYSSMHNFSWVHSSMTLAEEFARVGGRRMVVAGSCYEYDQRYGLCHESRTPTNSDTIYGTCKNALQQLLSAFCEETEVSFAWPRVFFLYGPNEHPQRLVSSVICSLLKGEQARCSHGGQLRDYLYVEDVAEALTVMTAGNISGPVNIGRGAPHTLREIVECIAAQVGSPDLLALGALPARPNEVPLVLADTARIRGELNWQPRFSLEEGVARTIAWWRSELGAPASKDCAGNG